MEFVIPTMWRNPSFTLDALESYLSIEEIKKFEPKVNIDVIDVFNLKNSVNSKKSYGGTSFENIKKMIRKYKNA